MRRGALLLFNLLLQLPLALFLHLLPPLLRAHKLRLIAGHHLRAIGRSGLRLLGRLYILVFLRLRRWSLRLRLRSWRGAGAEDDLARGALALIAEHEDVVTGAVQEVAEDLPGRGGAVDAEDALVMGEAGDLRSRICRHLGEDLVEAGVGCLDFEAVAVPCDGGRHGRLIGGPVRPGRRGRRRGDCRDGFGSLLALV